VLKPLHSGATIGISAPAGPVKREKLEQAVARLHTLGFRTKLSASVFGKHGFLSATDETRKRELEDLFSDPEVDSVWCARGGVGSSRLLGCLNLELIAKSDKPFLGFSDITALQWAMWAKHRAITFTGPLAIEFDGTLTRETEQFSVQMLTDTLSNNWLDSFPTATPNYLRKGAREIIAPVMPGNLTMISTLLGTKWMPDLRGHILVIEDIAEPAYRMDRLLFHLKNAGVFANLAALIVGDFCWQEEDCESRERMTESLLDATKGTSYPIVTEFPYGHGATRMTLPVGSPVRVSLAENKLAMSFAISPFAPSV